MATAEMSKRTGKPKRKYTRRTVKSAAPQPPQPTEETPLSTEEMAEITSNNIIPSLKEKFTTRRDEIDSTLAQNKQAIKEYEASVKALTEERETINRTLKVLK